MTNPWTLEAEDVLRRLWEAGISAQDIANRLNVDLSHKHRFTRNSVIGKAHRLKLGKHNNRPHKALEPAKPRKRATPWPASIKRAFRIPPKPKAAPTSPTKPRRPPKMAEIIPAPQCPPVRFVDRTDAQCSWPVGNDRPGPDMLCCGAPKTNLPSVPYCAYHQRQQIDPRYRDIWRSERRVDQFARAVE